MSKSKRRDDSKLVPIYDITKNIDEIEKIDYKVECEKLQKYIKQLENELKDRDAKIAELHKIPSVMKFSVEEEIALSQLERLNEAAQNRALSLEEVKIFDLLTKNKRLAQGESTVINADYEKIKGLSKTELIKIANKTQRKKS